MGNGALSKTNLADDQKKYSDLEELFLNTIFNKSEQLQIKHMFKSGGISKVLEHLEVVPLLPLIMDWFQNQLNLDENCSETEQIIYLLDMLHPNQSCENKRDLAWKVYNVDDDEYIGQEDLVMVYRHILPSLPVSRHQVLARRALSVFADNRVVKENFELLLPDNRLIEMFSKTIF